MTLQLCYSGDIAYVFETPNGRWSRMAMAWAAPGDWVTRVWCTDNEPLGILVAAYDVNEGVRKFLVLWNE